MTITQGKYVNIEDGIDFYLYGSFNICTYNLVSKVSDVIWTMKGRGRLNKPFNIHVSKLRFMYKDDEIKINILIERDKKIKKLLK